VQKFYNKLKYIVNIGITLASTAVVVNQELMKAKIEGVVMEVARMGQWVDHMDQRVNRMDEKLDQMEKKMEKKFERMEKKMDKLLSQQFVTNF